VNSLNFKTEHPGQQIKKLNAPIQAEIVIPTPLVEPLIKALSENYETYKKNIMPK
jgi:hypothetical protein